MLLPIFTLMLAVFGLGFGIAGIVLYVVDRSKSSHCNDDDDDD